MPSFADLLHDIQHFADQLRVEGGGGFIKEHDLGFHRERACNGDALFLPAREAIWIFILLEQHAHAIQVHFCNFDGMRRIHRLDDDGRPHNIFQHTVVGKEIELLKDHASQEARLVDKRLVLLALGARRYPEIGYFDRSFRGFLKEIDAPQHRTLSRAASSDDANHLPLVDVQINSFQHMQMMERLIKVCEFIIGADIASVPWAVG